MTQKSVATACLLACSLAGCASASTPAPLPALASTSSRVLAYVGATVIGSPDAPPIADGVVLVEDGRIASVGAAGLVQVPRDARLVDCRGTTLVAAFWNAHVHFVEARWSHAADAPAAELQDGLRTMLLRWGFAHVFDTGSWLPNTNALRDRIERGELFGPSIRTTGAPFVAVGGQPVYLSTPLQELGSVEAAREGVRQRLSGRADAIKLMTASLVAHPPSPVMPISIVRAVVDEAHARGALVFAHPTNGAGVRAARDGGVDILAHTAPEAGPWSADDAASLVRAGMSLVPTLSLWRRELEARDPAEAARYEAIAVDQVRAFAAAGGAILFGTDVGYRTEYDPTPEHELLARSGLSFSARLAALTTAPAARFHEGTGRLEAGAPADLVVLDGDPVANPRAFARVRCTVRGGIVLYAAANADCG